MSKLLLPIIILMFSFTALGQSRSVKPDEFEYFKDRAYELRESKSYRKTTVSTTLENKIQIEKTIHILESKPSGDYYVYSLVESKSGISIVEYVKVSKERLVRRGGGIWKTEQLGGVGDGSGGVSKAKIKFLGASKLKGEVAYVFELSQESYGVIKNETLKYWFHQNGLLMKKLSIGESTDKSTSRVIAEDFDYDKPINIKLPNIVDTDLRIISKPNHRYTDKARINNEQGEVLLRVEFLANGKIGNIFVIQGLKYGLTEEAIKATRNIKFVPAQIRKQPVSTTKTISRRFKLY